MTLTVAIVADGTGKTLAETESWVPALGGPRNVAVAGSSIPSRVQWHAEITVTGQSQPVAIGTGTGGKAVLDTVRPVAGQGVSVVHTGDATIYQRSSALDRVRWASDQRVLASTDNRLAALAGHALSDDTVVLSTSTDHRADRTGDAVVRLRPSAPSETVADVDATGGGWLVVADSLRRPGWHATVDGEPTDLVAADNAGGAVWVPRGSHTVRLSYSVPGLTAGWLVTGGTVGIAVLTTVTVLVVGRRRRRRARTAD